MERKNMDLITRNACSSNLRPVKVFLLGKEHAHHIMCYDAILPRRGKEAFVTDMILKHHKIKEGVINSKKYHKILLDKDNNFVRSERPHKKELEIPKGFEKPENSFFENSFQDKVDKMNTTRKISMLSKMFEHPDLEEPGESEHSDIMKEKLHDFYIHPLVYPSLDSLLEDLSLKTFEKFDACMVFNHKYELIRNVDQARKHIFIVDKQFLSHVTSKYCKDSTSDEVEEVAKQAEKIYDLVMRKRKMVIPFAEEFEFNRPKKVEMKNLPYEEGIYDINEGDKSAYEKTQKKIYKADPCLYSKIWKFKRGVAHTSSEVSPGVSPGKTEYGRMARASSSLPRLDDETEKAMISSKLLFKDKNNKMVNKLPKTSAMQSPEGSKLSILNKIEFLGSCEINKVSAQSQNLFVTPTAKLAKLKNGSMDYQAMKSNYNKYIDPKSVRNQSIEARMAFKDHRLGGLRKEPQTTSKDHHAKKSRRVDTKDSQVLSSLQKSYKIAKELMKRPKRTPKRLPAANTLKEIKLPVQVSPSAQASLNDLKIRTPNYESLLMLKTGDFLQSFMRKEKSLRANKTNVSLKKSGKGLIPLETVIQRNEIKNSIDRNYLDYGVMGDRGFRSQQEKDWKEKTMKNLHKKMQISSKSPKTLVHTSGGPPDTHPKPLRCMKGVKMKYRKRVSDQKRQKDLKLVYSSSLNKL
ncbi:unnamed protein product [Moneuplotes crassus]|uniref:Uncharacterized protein n=1 Tax=Euplotes crassus TaxID=5936 RepID=A0AAD1Y5I0_EUPCR|nr:unnamed protein product [Moneuplotes crassus]